ncbi:MAG: hypothetical protein NZ888_02630 [Candidatus Nitrosocaldus sp.]|nr:hypothetical protein [Candidatus Nitrosocaldus sp.]MDW8000029.1 hypothetical protein [Candidatus Nitrosocaldus sp.]
MGNSKSLGKITLILVVIAVSVVATSLMTMGLGLDVGQSGSSSSRIVVIDYEWDGSITTRYVKVGDMRPNSSMNFLDPFGKTMQEFYRSSTSPNPASLARLLQSKDADAYEYYMLLRLPAVYGGSSDEISSYRAYSKVGINMLQKCLLLYHSYEGKQRMEDPCSGDVYRVWDGLVVAGYSASSNITGSPNALARLRLGVDADGYIVAFKGDNSITGDGVAGHGRIISGKDVLESSRVMLDAIKRYSGVGIDLPMLDGYIPTRADTQWRWIDEDGMQSSAHDRQRVEYISVEYSGMDETSGYTLGIFDIERYPTLRLVPHEGPQSILRMLGYSDEPEPHTCKYERRAEGSAGVYYVMVGKLYMGGDGSCSISSYNMLIWVDHDRDGVAREYLVTVDGYMLSSEEMLALARAIGYTQQADGYH